MNKDKTIKQIADELGVDKQKVYRFITKNHITASSEVVQSKYYDESAQSLILSAFSHITTSEDRIGEAHQKSGQDLMLETLIKELDEKNKQLSVKDKQIDELNARLAETTTALVTAQQTAQVAQALHAGTIRQQLESGGNDPSEPDDIPPKKHGVFDRIFGKVGTRNNTK